jgi:hypothetical protein
MVRCGFYFLLLIPIFCVTLAFIGFIIDNNFLIFSKDLSLEYLFSYIAGFVVTVLFTMFLVGLVEIFLTEIMEW